MNRRGFILGLGVLAVLTGFALSPASADGKRVALVIGNSTYRNVPTLPNPANDGADIAAALTRLGFAVTPVTNASFDQMRRSLIAFGRDAAGAGRSPFASSLASTKRSIGELTHAPFFTGGSGRSAGGWNAQNFRAEAKSMVCLRGARVGAVSARGSGAPSSIHLRKSAI